jgi:hypothetical protein
MLYDILELPDITRPVIVKKDLHDLLGETPHRLAVGSGMEFKELFGKQGDIVKRDAITFLRILFCQLIILIIRTYLAPSL